MSFYDYMIQNYANGTGLKSDLANDMKYDESTFPRNPSEKFNIWHSIIEIYLNVQGACAECMYVFEMCWKEYVAHEENSRS